MKLVLFDIDGTILTSRGVGRKAIASALHHVSGISVTSDGVSFAGRTDPQIMRDLLRAGGLSKNEIENVFCECMDSYVAILMRTLIPEMITILPGIQGLIRTLHGRSDIALGLLTGNLKDTAFLKLHAAGLGSYFSFGAYGSDREDRNELPHVAADRAALAFGSPLAVEKTVIVGDTPNDIECAAQYGARSVAVCTGVFSRSELAQCDADLLVDDFMDPEPMFELLDRL